MKAQLTKEQSQHLIDLGVPKEKASESQRYYNYFVNGRFYDPKISPIFTLTDLLEILPKEIIDPVKYYFTYRVSDDGFYIVSYNYYYSSSFGWGVVSDYKIFFKREELIDSLYELCVWCLKNKYLKF